MSLAILNPSTREWIDIATGAATAVGTVGAVIVALYLSRRERRPQLNVEAAITLHPAWGELIGDAPRGERNRFDPAVRGFKDELVGDEIKGDREAPMIDVHREGRESARGNLKRNVPEMVDDRCVGKTDLSDDLHPHVESFVGAPPLGERQRRPRFLAR